MKFEKVLLEKSKLVADLKGEDYPEEVINNWGEGVFQVEYKTIQGTFDTAKVNTETNKATNPKKKKEIKSAGTYGAHVVAIDPTSNKFFVNPNKAIGISKIWKS